MLIQKNVCFLTFAAVAQSVKRPELRSLKEVQLTDVSLIPGHSKGGREKILALPSVVV